ncbi:MAG: hypothetical protein ABSE62_03745 [Chthoniobacteraceae bacterium]|jgi:predicted  nucleic acid-binding Zn-ribbon protein
MARIALGITLVLILVTGFFAFETRTKVLGLTDQVATLNTNLAAATQARAKAEADLRTTKETLDKTQDELTTTQAQLQTAQSALDTANQQIASDKTQITTLNSELAAYTKPTQGTTTTAVTYPQDYVDKLNQKINDLTAQVAELNQVKETLTNKEKDAESRADDLQKEVDHYKNGTIRNGLEGEVLAYNPGWNFVVLSLGDREGAVTNAEMILTRGNQQIGKVRITSVEPSTSIADVEPGSVPRGVRIQPGDHVIFPGS